jgi:hypothetical protein
MSMYISPRPCSDIAPCPIDWLWQPFLARGKLAVLDGDPGSGKSLLTVDLAARLSRGGPMPDGRPLARPHTTILLNAEDDPADTVRPRAAAAGADLARVFAAGGPNEPLPPIPGGISDLTKLVYEFAADLLVIDPLSAFLPRSAASSELAARQAIGPLSGLAAETGCAVLLVRHRVGASGPNAAYRGRGSGGILGLARTGMVLARHPDDPELRVLALSKTNLGAAGGSLGFRLTPGGTVEWTGAVDLSADELCGPTAAQVSRRPRERAAEFLREALATGPRPVSELEKLAMERGLNWRTVERAKEALKLSAKQERDGPRSCWVWSDPAVRAADTVAKLAEIDEIARVLLRKRPSRTEAKAAVAPRAPEG